MNPVIRHVLSRKPTFTQVEAFGRDCRSAYRPRVLEIGRPHLGTSQGSENCDLLLCGTLVPDF